jgi:alcohol dehydrogenase
LVAEATAINIRALSQRSPGDGALDRYARVAELLCGPSVLGRDNLLAALVAVLRDWTERLALPRLGGYGVTAGAIGKIVGGSRGSSMKTNPIVLTDDEIGEIVARRL